MTWTIDEARKDGASTADPLLLLLDFPGHRAEARITDLDLVDCGFHVEPLLGDPPPDKVSGRAYAAELAASRPHTPAVAGILAYCSSSAIAVHYAHLVIKDRQPPPPLVFFDAEPAGTRDIVDAYTTACDQIGRRHSSTGPVVDVAALIGQPEKLLAEIRRNLLSRAEQALRAEGLSDRAAAGPVAHITGQHVAWIAHLLAVRCPIPRKAHSGMLHVISRGHPDHRDWLPEGELQTVRVDCERSTLLKHPAARKAVLDFLCVKPTRR